jgi:hypothetical protein
MNNTIKINKLIEEAEANLTIYQNGQDNGEALKRYNQIMRHVRTLRDKQ